MTEKEKQEIIELVHNTILGFFEDTEVNSRPFTKEETLLLEVNKAICEKTKEMPTIETERPHGKWKLRSPYEAWFEEYKCSNCNAYGWFNWHFCPNCGADMREGEQNERS